jgi:hypothetical protein
MAVFSAHFTALGSTSFLRQRSKPTSTVLSSRISFAKAPNVDSHFIGFTGYLVATFMFTTFCYFLSEFFVATYSGTNKVLYYTKIANNIH